MSRFSDFVKSSPCDTSKLPLCHTCQGYDFRNIMEEGNLKPQLCEVFEGDLLIYFFYGRPAYRVSGNQNATSIKAFMPVVIVLKPEAIERPKRIAPFDTGAYHRGLFSQYMHPEMTCDDFLLDPSMDMPPRLVSKFLSTNIEYFRGTPRVNISIPPLEFEAECYYNLICSKQIAPHDDRSSTVEIQIDSCIQLKGNVLLIVSPYIFLDQQEVKDAIKEWGAQYRGYSITRTPPNQYTALIYSEVEEFLLAEGYL